MYVHVYVYVYTYVINNNSFGAPTELDLVFFLKRHNKHEHLGTKIKVLQSICNFQTLAGLSTPKADAMTTTQQHVGKSKFFLDLIKSVLLNPAEYVTIEIRVIHMYIDMCSRYTTF
jgi:hypothetical protein